MQNFLLKNDHCCQIPLTRILKELVELTNLKVVKEPKRISTDKVKRLSKAIIKLFYKSTTSRFYFQHA